MPKQFNKNDFSIFYILTRPQFEHRKGLNPTPKRGDGSKGND